MKELGFQEIPIEKIRPPKIPIREPYVDPHFVESVKETILAPPIVNKLKGDKFEIIVGNRRYKAAKEAGLVSIRCMVVEATPDEVFKMTLAENHQRDDPSQMDTAAYIANYIDTSKKSVQEVALDVKMNRTTLSNLLRVYRHRIMRKEVAEGHYPMPAAILLLSIEPRKTKTQEYASWRVFIDKQRGTSFHVLRSIVEAEKMSRKEKSGELAGNEENAKKDGQKEPKIKKDEAIVCDGCLVKFTRGELNITKLCPGCREILRTARKDVAENEPLYETATEVRTDRKPRESIETRPIQSPGLDTSKTPRKHKLKSRKNQSRRKGELPTLLVGSGVEGC